MSKSTKDLEAYWQSTDGDTENDILFSRDLKRTSARLRPQSANAIHKLLNKPRSTRHAIATGLALILASSTKEVLDLQERLQHERAGMGGHLETYLRTVLQKLGINIHPEVNYGQYIPNNIRLYWQENGIDPESEDEVSNFLKLHQITHLENPGPLNRKQADAIKAAISLVNPRPLPKPTPPGMAE